MHHQDDNEYEQRLRAAFEPEPEAIDRVVAAATQPRSSRPMVLRVAAGSAVAAVVIVWLFLSLQPFTVKAESVRLEYVGNVALLEFPDGSCWLVTPDSNDKARSAPLNMIILEGDKEGDKQ
jgi:ferric-dicitrate binding protein FerR (iron transport regulator)